MARDDLGPLRRAIELSQRARARGNRPFGALLVDAGGTVRFEGENTVTTERDATGHAELNLIREASRQLPAEQLAGATIYASTEPCAMCAAAIYWSGIGRVVFGLSSARLGQVSGDRDDHLRVSSRGVLDHGDRVVEVLGPLLEDEALVAFDGFWR